MKFQYFLVKETESEIVNNYLEIIAGRGQASSAYGIWYETITTEHKTN